MTSDPTAGRSASAVLPPMVLPSIALPPIALPPIALPLTLCAVLMLGLVAMQTHLLCDVFCLHGEAHTVPGEICRG